jgi:hypothetical protein
MNNGHWLFPEDLDHEKACGFVYVIRDKESGMMYIGKKYFRGNGKLNKGKESNWKSYASSSNELKARMKELGKDKFEFHVLEQYYTRGGVSWAETWSQTVVEVPSNNHIWYNRFIDKVTWKSTETITDRHKERLRNLLEEYYK